MSDQRPYVKTYSVCVGNAACNAKCPFCVARMTAPLGSQSGFKLNERNLVRGARLAREYGATTALITGKGEPTLCPEELIRAAQLLGEVFPVVEVQTNGMKLSDYIMLGLYKAGVTTIALSCVHFRDEYNRECYGPRYSLVNTVNAIHLKKMSVRLTVMCVKGWIDTPGKVDHFIRVAKGMSVEQTTFRSITVGSVPGRAPEISKWTEDHAVDMRPIQKIVEDKSVQLESLVHGNVYAYQFDDGTEQNVCLSNCLTRNPGGNVVRQLIYCPDGHVRYDWEHDAAIVF